MSTSHLRVSEQEGVRTPQRRIGGETMDKHIHEHQSQRLRGGIPYVPHERIVRLRRRP